jgi:hypothetical protein
VCQALSDRVLSTRSEPPGMYGGGGYGVSVTEGVGAVGVVGVGVVRRETDGGSDHGGPTTVRQLIGYSLLSSE